MPTIRRSEEEGEAEADAMVEEEEDQILLRADPPCGTRALD
jgi:hypothetical protein